MKNITRLLAAAGILILATATAHALPVGDNAELFVTGDASVRADSNIFLTNNNVSDTVFEAEPGLELDFGHGSATTGILAVAEDLNVYTSHSGLNSSLPTASFNGQYEDGKTKLGLKVKYDELNQNTVNTRGGNTDELVRRNIFDVGGTGEAALTEKTSVATGLEYEDTNYLHDNYSDLVTASIPVDFYYELTPKTDVGFGYRYRGNWVQTGVDSKDDFYHLSARGEFTPKLSGSISVGITERHFLSGTGLAGVGRNVSLLGVDSNLSYAATPKVTLQLGVTNDFDQNAFAQQEKTLSVNAGVTARISPEWEFHGGLNYRTIDYYTRTDDYWEGQVGLSYIVNVHVSITGAIAYRTNKSDLTSYQFDDSVFSVGANFRF